MERQPLISFITTDVLSGMEHYKLKYIDITPEKKEEETGFFTEVVSPYKLPYLEVGRYLVVVRAYDDSGNWREQTVKIEIFPEGIYFSKKGIHYRQFLFPWWLLILILLIILLLVLYLKWRREKNLFKEEKKRLTKTGERLDKTLKNTNHENTEDNKQ